MVRNTLLEMQLQHLSEKSLNELDGSPVPIHSIWILKQIISILNCLLATRPCDGTTYSSFQYLTHNAVSSPNHSSLNHHDLYYHRHRRHHQLQH
mmetsp:Transcript_8072/g.12038  ORF Transcript_8072/g.12038 Transcript_8072/m.12038 type:complete len:94 (+) Transcript_8072:38-319(+)